MGLVTPVPKPLNDQTNQTGSDAGDANGAFPDMSLVMYASIAAFFVIAVAFVVFILLVWKLKSNRHDEPKLLEIDNARAQIIRYNIWNDDHERPITDSHYRNGDRRPSRIHPSPADLESSISFISSLAATTIREREKPETYPDVSDKFVVPQTPQPPTSTLSMFRAFDMADIKKELYYRSKDSMSPTERSLGQGGSVQIVLSFDPQLSLLTVRLIQASNLLALRTDSPPNPYFKVHLVAPDRSQCHQSKVYEKTRSPELGEEFYFDVEAGNLKNCKLEVMVYDFDQYAIDELIGCCCVSLSRIDISDDPAVKTAFWAEITPVELDDEDGIGEILLKISYSSKGPRLILTVLKARNLAASNDMTEPPDPFIKATLFVNKKKLKSYRTSVKKSTYNPSYNEGLSFKLPKGTIRNVSLSVTVCHETRRFRKSTKLGRLNLDLSEDEDLWSAMSKGEECQAKWYSLENYENAG